MIRSPAVTEVIAASNMGVKVLNNRLLWMGPHKTIDQFTGLEDEQRGNSVNVELARRARVFVDI
jgi:hypothetical protein